MNKYLKQHVKDLKPGKALDLGAGEFKDVKKLIALGWLAKGVDLKIGIDLNKIYISESKPYDLVYSCFVLQFIKNKDTFIKNAYNNLKGGGSFYLLAMHKFDKQCTSDLTISSLNILLKNNKFKIISIRLFGHYDADPTHQHWHKLIEVIANK